jgi:hypothetical protein
VHTQPQSGKDKLSIELGQQLLRLYECNLEKPGNLSVPSTRHSPTENLSNVWKLSCHFKSCSRDWATTFATAKSQILATALKTRTSERAPRQIINKHDQNHLKRSRQHEKAYYRESTINRLRAGHDITYAGRNTDNINRNSSTTIMYSQTNARYHQPYSLHQITQKLNANRNSKHSLLIRSSKPSKTSITPLTNRSHLTNPFN